jgi:DMSO/TMAO reductase YedYZ molybdopterin-dependent catalytic subunit
MKPPQSTDKELILPAAEAERHIRVLTRRSLLRGALAAGAGLATWHWAMGRSEDGGLPWPLRRALEYDERLAEAVYRPDRLVPTFAPARADPNPRVNGVIGLEGAFDAAAWQLQVVNVVRPGGRASFTLPEIQALPAVRTVMELKCVEGWSILVDWTGARLSDLMAQCPPPTRSGRPFDVRRPEDLPRYVAMATPDAAYFVGLDMASALHPQTLLAYAINGEPLSIEHGAPLRLVIPIKYGIKNLKRIGTILYTDTRPSDYWAEQGYDWYAGH